MHHTTFFYMTGVFITVFALFMWLNRKKYSTINVPPNDNLPQWPPAGWNTDPAPENQSPSDDAVLPPVYIPPAPSNSDAETKNLLGAANMPRGMKNNNPGNIRISDNAWTGKIPVNQNTDGSFEQFTLYKYGVRAMLKLVRNYIAAGHNTITKIVSRYAPSNENHTSNYITFIVQNTGINPNAPINANEYAALEAIIIAMAHFENGRADAVTQADVQTAWQLL